MNEYFLIYLIHQSIFCCLLGIGHIDVINYIVNNYCYILLGSKEFMSHFHTLAGTMVKQLLHCILCCLKMVLKSLKFNPGNSIYTAVSILTSPLATELGGIIKQAVYLWNTIYSRHFNVKQLLS